METFDLYNTNWGPGTFNNLPFKLSFNSSPPKEGIVVVSLKSLFQLHAFDGSLPACYIPLLPRTLSCEIRWGTSPFLTGNCSKLTMHYMAANGCQVWANRLWPLYVLLLCVLCRRSVSLCEYPLSPPYTALNTIPDPGPSVPHTAHSAPANSPTISPRETVHPLHSSLLKPSLPLQLIFPEH